jgi:hypothetical protein
MHDRDTYRDDVDAERGYSEVSARELRLRDWEATRPDASFEKLVKRLRTRKWQREVYAEAGPRLDRIRQKNREAMARRWRDDPAFRAQHIERYRDQRRKAPVICRCIECGATWCRVLWVRGVVPSVCGPNCAARYGYHRRQLAAGKVSRRTGRYADFGAGLGLVSGGGVSPANAAATVRERVLAALAKRGSITAREARALCAEISKPSYSGTMQQLRLEGVIVREGWAKGARWKLAATGREGE